MYIMKDATIIIYSYESDVTSDSWSQLPDCFHNDGSIAIINGTLTTIGGGSSPFYSNELFSLTGEGSVRRWTQQFPPMPTKRRWTTSLCTGTALIVAGGWGIGSLVLSTVEIMNTETHQWSTAADLPQPMYHASATVCGDQLYMLGGVEDRLHVCQISVHLFSECPPPVSYSGFIGSKISENLFGRQSQSMEKNCRFTSYRVHL